MLLGRDTLTIVSIPLAVLTPITIPASLPQASGTYRVVVLPNISLRFRRLTAMTRQSILTPSRDELFLALASLPASIIERAGGIDMYNLIHTDVKNAIDLPPEISSGHERDLVDAANAGSSRVVTSAFPTKMLACILPDGMTCALSISIVLLPLMPSSLARSTK